MVLLGEEAQVEAWFGLFGDSANLMQDNSARFAWNVPYAWKSIWTHPMELQLLDEVCHMYLALVRLDTSLVLVQDKCTVCA